MDRKIFDAIRCLRFNLTFKTWKLSVKLSIFQPKMGRNKYKRRETELTRKNTQNILFVLFSFLSLVFSRNSENYCDQFKGRFIFYNHTEFSDFPWIEILCITFSNKHSTNIFPYIDKNKNIYTFYWCHSNICGTKSSSIDPILTFISLHISFVSKILYVRASNNVLSS